MLTTDIFDDATPHAFLGRRGGVSTGLYDSLNCALGSNDDPDAVRENRRRAAMRPGLKPESLATVYQVHSANCLTIVAPPAERPKADAMATDRPGIALGILTADCAPILLSGRKADGHPVIGAAHAGWRGALGGVIENTVAAMRDLGALAIAAAIGPAIAQPSYEVGHEFMAAFTEGDRRFFAPGRHGDVRQFDLAAYIHARLTKAGIDTVWSAGMDTYTSENDYFSYRRATHRHEPDYGRQLSIISIA